MKSLRCFHRNLPWAAAPPCLSSRRGRGALRPSDGPLAGWGGRRAMGARGASRREGVACSRHACSTAQPPTPPCGPEALTQTCPLAAGVDGPLLPARSQRPRPQAHRCGLGRKQSAVEKRPNPRARCFLPRWPCSARSW